MAEREKQIAEQNRQMHKFASATNAKNMKLKLEEEFA